uniref:Uncharacterized protein n=1 Tax=Oryctolagus cuniculus TaxID=9986 RepID=A0A5F9DGM3_RABIT
MVAGSWQDELAQQSKEGSARMQEMLPALLGFLRTKLGLDLGLELKRYLGWVILVVHGSARAAAALPAMLRLGRGLCWRPQEMEEPATQKGVGGLASLSPDDLALLKNLKNKGRKKKNRKKLPEKPRPNGRTIEVAEGEVVRTPRSRTAKQPRERDKKAKSVLK